MAPPGQWCYQRLVPGATDLLYITGTASGTTTLTLRSIAPNAPFVTGATVVTAQGGLNPNAFTADCANVNPAMCSGSKWKQPYCCIIIERGHRADGAGLSGVIASTASRSESFQSTKRSWIA